jgi:hypothetical protein
MRIAEETSRSSFRFDRATKTVARHQSLADVNGAMKLIAARIARSCRRLREDVSGFVRRALFGPSQSERKEVSPRS